MSYKVLIEKRVEKDLKKIPEEIQIKIISTILELKDSSRPLNIRKIGGLNNYYRIRIGDYRIIYEINDKEKEISIFRIRHRKEAYLNL